jgi:hypothetical protein
MRKYLFTAVVAGLLAGPAMADSIGPGGTWDGFSFNVIKTPPATATQVFTYPISYHSTFAYNNWAGVGFSVGFDATEVSGVNVVGINGHFNTGGGPVVTLWNSAAINSGIFNGPSSVPFPVGLITFHATGTTLGQNSDTDITFNAQLGFGGAGFSPFNIFHLTSFQSGSYILYPSLLIYVPLTPGGGPGEPGQVVEPGFGTWIHLQDTRTVFLPASIFFGTTAFISGQGGIGIEHVPEPASAAMIVGGLGLIAAAVRRRMS